MILIELCKTCPSSLQKETIKKAWTYGFKYGRDWSRLSDIISTRFYEAKSLHNKKQRIPIYLTKTVLKTGFIESSDHRTSVHRPTDHRPLSHQPADQPTIDPPTQPTRFYFKDLMNEKYSFYRKQTAVKLYFGLLSI